MVCCSTSAYLHIIKYVGKLQRRLEFVRNSVVQLNPYRHCPVTQQWTVIPRNRPGGSNRFQGLGCGEEAAAGAGSHGRGARTIALGDILRGKNTARETLASSSTLPVHHQWFFHHPSTCYLNMRGKGPILPCCCYICVLSSAS